MDQPESKPQSSKEWHWEEEEEEEEYDDEGEDEEEEEEEEDRQTITMTMMMVFVQCLNKEQYLLAADRYCVIIVRTTRRLQEMVAPINLWFLKHFKLICVIY